MTVSQGADYSHARPSIAWLKSKNISFVCRYVLDAARDGGKRLTVAEAQQLSAAGIAIAANFEYATQPVLEVAQGYKDAMCAARELELIGAPRRVVYFSFDYDVPPVQFPAVWNYLKGAASVIGAENVGAYGHYKLIEFLAAAGVKWLWQTCAWSYGKWSPHATVRQVSNGHWPGEHDADLNTAMQPDIGAWILGQDPQEGDTMATLSDEDYKRLMNAVARIGDMYLMTAGPHVDAQKKTLAGLLNLDARLTNIGAGGGSALDVQALARAVVDEMGPAQATALHDALADALTSVRLRLDGTA